MTDEKSLREEHPRKYIKMREQIEKMGALIHSVHNHMEFNYDPHMQTWYFAVRRRLEGKDYISRFSISEEEIENEHYLIPEFQRRFEKFCEEAMGSIPKVD